MRTLSKSIYRTSAKVETYANSLFAALAPAIVLALILIAASALVPKT